MYTKQEKENFAKRVALLAEKTDMPYEVCMALGGEEAKITMLKDTLLSGIDRDLSDLTSSFLYNQVVERINIDADTGKTVNSVLPYNYLSELRSEDVFEVIMALRKLMRGITGSSILFNELEIKSLSKRNLSTLANYTGNLVLSALFTTCMKNAMDMLDPAHVKDLKDGVFYIKPGTKQVRAMWILCFLHIKKVVVPYGTTVIRPYAFENAEIQEIELPRTVSHIHRGAFLGCKLHSVWLPENRFLTELGLDAFYGNPIETISIPKNIEALDFYAFRKTPLKEVTVSTGTKIYHKPKNVVIKEV